MRQQDIDSGNKPRLLFVDDEQRVLNSMRIMFRRQFDLFLASSGAEALEIVKHKNIDVIVADHRMPQMTGVEVLTKARSISPRTVRILLTGYADLDAVEGSINECEVFRFLTKPCAPEMLRETITLAAKLALTAPVHDSFDFPEGELSDESVLEMIMAGDAAALEEAAAQHLGPEPEAAAPGTADTAEPPALETPLLAPELMVSSLPATALEEPKVAQPRGERSPPKRAPERPAKVQPSQARRATPEPRVRRSKPRAPQQRGSAAAAPTAPAAQAPERDFAATDVLDKPPTIERPEPAAPAQAAPSRKPRLAAGLGVVVFSLDEQVVATVQNAVRGRLPVYCASNVVKVVKILTDHQPGVLVTDISDDKATIQAMTARLKEHLPELVTIAVSEHRDVLDMVWLINHGQIFRFLRKPLSSGRCAISLQAALKHHRMLLRNPELVKRHQVAASEDGGLVDGVLSKLKNMRRLWASA
jgi:response regulator RpfG family c-di-GMP phosphodiesterase